MDSGQVLRHGPPLGRPADEGGLEGVPEHDDLPAQLRDIAVGNLDELVLGVHGLGGLRNVLQPGLDIGIR